MYFNLSSIYSLRHTETIWPCPMWLNEPMNDPSDFGICFDKVSYQMENIENIWRYSDTMSTRYKIPQGQWWDNADMADIADSIRQLKCSGSCRPTWSSWAVDWSLRPSAKARDAKRCEALPTQIQCKKKYHKTSNWIKCLWNGIVLRELYVAKPRPLDWVGWQAFGWISASKYLPNVHIESSTILRYFETASWPCAQVQWCDRPHLQRILQLGFEWSIIPEYLLVDVLQCKSCFNGGNVWVPLAFSWRQTEPGISGIWRRESSEGLAFLKCWPGASTNRSGGPELVFTRIREWSR